MTRSKFHITSISYLFFALLLMVGLSACRPVAPADTASTSLDSQLADSTAEPIAVNTGKNMITTAQASMPVLTEDHQGLTYGPDQLVLVFVEGFQTSETLSVSAMHETVGVVKSAEAQANARGEAIIYHYTQPSAEDEGAYPAGAITFWVSGSSGTVKSYTFRIDYAHTPQPAQMGCGRYPDSPIHRGSAFVAWCSGFLKDSYQITEYKAPMSISQGGNVLLSEPIADIMADGLGLVWLYTESGDPTGVWDIAIDTQTIQIQVEE